MFNKFINLFKKSKKETWKYAEQKYAIDSDTGVFFWILQKVLQSTSGG